MESSMVITWSIIVLIIVSLVVIARIRSRKKKTGSLKRLQDFANEHHGVISTFNYWDKTLIGIDDREDKKLFFIRTKDDNEVRTVVNLSEVRDCRLVKKQRNATHNKEKVIVTEEIKLVFSHRNGKQDISLEFFNTAIDHLTLADELQMAQKWEGIAKGIIAAQKVGKRSLVHIVH